MHVRVFLDAPDSTQSTLRRISQWTLLLDIAGFGAGEAVASAALLAGSLGEGELFLEVGGFFFFFRYLLGQLLDFVEVGFV